MSRAFGRSVGPQEAFTNNVGVGAGLGAAAYVVNYVLIYLFATIDGVDFGESSAWKVVGNFLYNAQFVATEFSGGGTTITVNYVTGSSSNEFFDPSEIAVGSTVPSFVYHLVPIVVLVVAGVLVAQQVGSRLDTQSAAAAGATITPGVFVLALVGTFLFDFSEGSGSAAPELAMGVLLVGIVFPLVLGAVGGPLGHRLRGHVVDPERRVRAVLFGAPHREQREAGVDVAGVGPGVFVEAHGWSRAPAGLNGAHRRRAVRVRVPYRRARSRHSRCCSRSVTCLSPSTRWSRTRRSNPVVSARNPRSNSSTSS